MKEDIGGLLHTTSKLKGGGEVIVLNTGAHISPEADAMLQALHSRSAEGIRSHMKVFSEKGSDKFMGTFYVGYGHKSIGDCGTTSIFIEGVSMLVAKAIQDWRLYSGQESSTRYIDFSSQRFANPLGSSVGEAILESWRGFYISSLGPVREHVRSQFPRASDEDEKKYEKAVNARTFDILRGFLPAGSTTNLAWHSNLRQIADKLAFLRHHPLLEVREVAQAIEDVVLESFPNSFARKRYEQTEAYNEVWMKNFYYFVVNKASFPDYAISYNGIDKKQLTSFKEALHGRPPQTELPNVIGECGTMQFSFLLDYGSFRDIQRHRSVIQRMPLLTPDLGFEEWYLNELPSEVKENALKLLKRQLQRIEIAGLSREDRQYYLPMGYKIPNRITGDIPSLVYIAELRSSPSVHPTLQKRAVQIGKDLEECFGDCGLKLHLHSGLGRFDIKRGDQDIVKK